ncbi:MAG: hypothetical protein H0X25_06690 [Acidobacteriales bacterium]|nr:hypothetical protein [Terriglobales bacterium]
MKLLKVYACICVAIFLLACLSVPAAADSIGRINVHSVSCDSVRGTGGVAGGSCYLADVSCPGIADQQAAIKVNQPSGRALGTVLFTPGGGGSPWWDVNFTYGTLGVQKVLDAGYTTVQFNFAYPPRGSHGEQIQGWLSGPGGARSLACRWATLADWAYKNQRPTSTSPMCATSASAGSGAAAYSVAFYGLGPEFTMLEETSGPVFDRIDNGCLCNAPNVQTACGKGSISECYLSEATEYIDPSYQNKSCSSAVHSHHSTMLATYIHDSLDADGAEFNFPLTYVHFLFGGQDGSSAVAQGTAWQSQITGTIKPPVDCAPAAGHRIADNLAGATQIATDIISSCH